MQRPTASGGGGLGYRLIGAGKLATALALTAAGFGIFRLLNRDLGEALEHFVTRVHLDPENEVVQSAAGALAGIDRSHLKAIGAGTFFYAALEGVEGVGLILRRRWASYLTVVATALLLLPEGYEIAHKVNALRLGVMAVNLAVLAYLVVKLRQEHRAGGHAP